MTGLYFQLKDFTIIQKSKPNNDKLKLILTSDKYIPKEVMITTDVGNYYLVYNNGNYEIELTRDMFNDLDSSIIFTIDKKELNTVNIKLKTDNLKEPIDEVNRIYKILSDICKEMAI